MDGGGGGGGGGGNGGEGGLPLAHAYIWAVSIPFFVGHNSPEFWIVRLCEIYLTVVSHSGRAGCRG